MGLLDVSTFNLPVFSPIMLLLAYGAMPPKESGNWIDVVFDWCVDLLLTLAAALGISYNAINVVIFCVAWPLLTLLLMGLALSQRAKIRRLEQQLSGRV